MVMPKPKYAVDREYWIIGRTRNQQFQDVPHLLLRTWLLCVPLLCH